MAQHYSYLLCKELKRILLSESNVEEFSRDFGSFWFQYYSFYSVY